LPKIFSSPPGENLDFSINSWQRLFVIGKSILFIKFLLCLSTISAPFLPKEKSEYLVCLHGFMGGTWSMHFLEKNLRKDGWDVVNWGYPSRDAFISQHGEHLAKELLDLAEKRPGKPIHFVAHSMGSLVLLAALNHPLCPEEAKIGKVVLIAPPLKGSVWGRWLNQFSFAKWLAKDFSGQELMTKSDFGDLGEYPDSLESLLVIAGSFGFNPVLQGVNDGTIDIHETSLSTPHERIVINRGHKTIVFSKKVFQVISQFLLD
jgi:pimeloyl-ACP methyl ester carboxylesterase